MDKADQIAQSIVSGAILQNLHWTILSLAISMLGMVAVGYLAAWGQKRGEINAARRDRLEILKQFGDKATAEEAAKSAIQRAEWKAKELATVRRVKLEELLTALNECNEYLLRETNWWHESGMPNLAGNPAFKLRAIALLYFPEFDIVPFQKAFSLCRDRALEGKREIEGAKYKTSDEQHLAQQRAARNYMENGYNFFAAAATAMEKQAAPLMHQLLELSVMPRPTEGTQLAGGH